MSNNIEGKVVTGSSQAAAGYSYPGDLARFVRDRWGDVPDVGARHRSAYRLAEALPGAVAIVISQDGGVRFIGKKGGRVTYWEQE